MVSLCLLELFMGKSIDTLWATNLAKSHKRNSVGSYCLYYKNVMCNGLSKCWATQLFI
jgi:hypothetical protein